MSYPVVEKTIAQLRHDLEAGVVSAVGLTRAYLDRIAAFDHSGPRLNSVVELNRNALAEAAASDARRAAGETLGPLDGIPFTAKDSYMVAGQTVASGSPAFAELRASRDAFTISQLRESGAIFIGLTNMPPMANGGMQRGLYGRAESPYNADFLTSAFASGSSNGSGTATAASFAAFGLGEETWSSGRAPASCNALCAYTPSRGVISVRGNWPLVPTMDVVVPHTRTMADLLEILDVMVADDPEKRGDFWRMQPWVSIPQPSDVRPVSYPALADTGASSLVGRRFGVPRMFLGTDPEQGTGTGMGSVTGERIEPRRSVLELWEQARADLEAAGATVVEVDFPVVTNYEADRAGAPNVFTRGIVPEPFFDAEIWELSMWSWHEFLAANGQPGLDALALVDGAKIFPPPPGALPDRYGSFDADISDYVTRAQRDGIIDPFNGPLSDLIRAGIEGLEATRKLDLEDWMDEHGLDAVLFPTMADVGPADADVNPESAELAWKNGVWVATGNLAIRHLGIPTVTVPMGTMSDIGMPVGLTIAGPAYSDTDLLRFAVAFESLRPRREAPARTPELAASI
ncbi:MAG TPA: amidase [Microbacteriaceae bacterium]|nr:amidase [Microbacteriaceae bacterium]